MVYEVSGWATCYARFDGRFRPVVLKTSRAKSSPDEVAVHEDVRPGSS
jgi:hypothetical protein